MREKQHELRSLSYYMTIAGARMEFGGNQMESDILKIENLSFSYHTLNGETRTLQDLSFSVKQG